MATDTVLLDKRLDSLLEPRFCFVGRTGRQTASCSENNCHRKAKQSAVHKYIDQKVQQLANDQGFKDSIAAVIPELVVTEAMIKKVIIQKVKELRG